MQKLTDRFTWVKDFEVIGRIFDDRIIALDYRVMDEFFTRTIDTGDEMIRDALVRLGWTPPPPDPHGIERKALELYNASFGDEVPLTPWRDLKPEQRIVWMQDAAERDAD